MKRIYHRWEVWEDYKAGFYNNCSGEKKKQFINEVLEMFNSKESTERYMNMVIEKWPKSCEHNLTNEGMNKIAYIGQAACCLYAGIPSTVTMEAWSKLDKKVQDRADSQALIVIEKWINKNKTTQLCLNMI